MSSRDFSPAPYPLYTEDGSGEAPVVEQEQTHERYWLYTLLFAVTLLTTTTVGAAMQIDFARNVPFDIEHSFDMYLWAWRHPSLLLQGLPFSLTLLAILMAHEMGHYVASVYHRVDASLPYFLPSPFLGTFGAFIRVRSPIYSKRVLFDIGVAGPIAGFVFLLPALAIGLAFSKVIPHIAQQGSLVFGAPLLERLLAWAIFPSAGAYDVYLHPVARAAWVGMFATSMNLLPIGQLDGGHILYSFFPQRHKLISKIICVTMLPLGYFWPGWFLWAVILFLLGRRHPLIYDPQPMSAGRRTLAWVALAIFILCFIYMPITEGRL